MAISCVEEYGVSPPGLDGREADCAVLRVLKAVRRFGLYQKSFQRRATGTYQKKMTMTDIATPESRAAERTSMSKCTISC
jgi:hypothetical protein